MTSPPGPAPLAHPVEHRPHPRDWTPWLTGPRAKLYAVPVWAVGLVLTAGLIWHILTPVLDGSGGRPLPTDFDAFWAGAHLALGGHPEAAYDATAIKAAELAITQPAGQSFFPYLYPPTFMLITLPLGLFGYLAALSLFLLAGYGLFVVCLRRLIPAPWSWLPILLSPAAMLTLVVGQNGFLSAACFAGATLLMPRRPAAAGACLGLLAFKPHLALAVPVVLLAARSWRALVGCAAAATALSAASLAVLGSHAWAAFLSAGGMMRTMLQSPLVWPKLASVYGAARQLHAGETAAILAQSAAALLAMTWVGRFAWRRPGGGAEIAALVPAGLLCTPFLWDYDLACLSVPVAFLAARSCRLGWRGGDKPLLVAAYLLPGLARGASLRFGLPLTPVLAACLLLVMTRPPERPGAAAPA